MTWQLALEELIKN